MTASSSIRLDGEKRLASYPALSVPEGGTDEERIGTTHAVAGSYAQTFSNAGMCLHALSGGTDYPLVELIRAATGWDFTTDEAIAAGKRALTLRQAFNARDGLTARDFMLPTRISAPLVGGPIAGRSFDFEALRERYHVAMGWDAETGVPSRQCLGELALERIVDL